MRPLHLAFALAALPLAAARADVVYSAVPAPLPTNLPSVGFEATSTSQFGDAVTLAGSARALTGATVIMSNWAVESGYEPLGTSAGYHLPLTFSVDAVAFG